MSFKFNPIEESNRLYLRGVNITDVTDDYISWMNDPEITRYLETRARTFSYGDLVEFVNEMNSTTDIHFFAICLKSNDAHIGNIRLRNIDWFHRRGDIGLLIGQKSCWGAGYATEALQMITHFGLVQLGLKKLTAGCYAQNIASLKAFTKNRWQQEGRLKNNVILDGKPHDWICLGISAEDYFIAP
ncbi:GNAT family N-acetyltransferase [Vreelandella arctica]|uniref:GNAT family N-acetyltransferase n=1 Tax=Vreelandella arctica TaxID=3126499 RepID=UPI00300DF003